MGGNAAAWLLNGQNNNNNTDNIENLINNNTQRQNQLFNQQNISTLTSQMSM